MTEHKTADETIEAIQNVADELGRAPKRNEFDEMADISYGVVERRFGTYRQGVLAAGLEPAGQDQTRITESELLLEMVRVADEVGGPPTRGEFKERNEYHPDTVAKRLGDYRSIAVEAWDMAAEIDPDELDDLV